MSNLSTPDDILEDEVLEEEDNPLRIDEPSFPEITEGEEPVADQMVLDRLPRPVHELNCRQARTYLVKLLRNANGGQNPHYGDPEMKPPFWPDYYWPWIKLTDVHTKPRGMNEPLQYSEMMKLAISRGYQYFGYDPSTYVDPKIEEANKTASVTTAVSTKTNPANNENNPPPRLLKPLSQLNCLHARTYLAKLLRYQQLGNNPVYGSPETRPPWWPDDCIRWVDMVDLRGRPPYLPDAKTYTDVLKIAIERAYQYYGYDPETHVEMQTGAAEHIKSIDEDMGQIMDEVSESLPVPDAPGAKHIKIMGPPPKLPIPVSKLNCGGARSCLSRLLRYRSGHQPPNYGNPQFMPSWWPNDIIEWAQIKNLSHRYEGYLGNSYSNCLRIAIIRGYAYYGYDANTYVDDPNGGSSTIYWSLGDPQNMTTSLSNTPLPKITSIRSEIGTKPKKPMPNLLLITNSDSSKEKDPSPQSDRMNDVIVPTLLSNLKPVPLKVRFCRKAHLILDFLFQDYLNHRRYTDIILVSSSGQKFKIHRFVLTLSSPKMKSILSEESPDQLTTLIFPDISSEVLKLIIHASYTGEVILDNERIKSEVMKAKEFLAEYELLQHFECYKTTSKNNDLADSSLVVQSPAMSDENLDFDTVGDKDEDQETDFDMIDSEKEGIQDDDINFDDIIEAVATKIEEEEKAVTSQKNKETNSLGIRRSFRTRRKKDMSDFELGGSDLDSPTPPVIKKEPIEIEEEERPVNDNNLVNNITHHVKVKLEKIDEPVSTRRSARNLSRKNQASEHSTKRPSSPLHIPIKRSRSSSSSSLNSIANKPRMEEIDIQKLDVIVEEGGSKALTTLLMKTGFLRERPPKCNSCRDHASLITDSSNDDGLVWRCSNSDHPDISVREHSIFEGSSESLTWIMKIIICWSDNTSLNQCYQLFGADVDKIFHWYERCKDYYGTL